jgi:hypothetical protein
MILAQFLASLAVIFGASELTPHGLYAHVELRNGQVHLESWFDDDTPAQQAKVKIIAGGHTLREGLTDDKGVWTTERLPPGKYQIQVDAGAGHRKELTFEMPADASAHTAGPTKNEVREQHWIGILLGLAVVLGLVLVAKRLLRRENH